MGVIRKLPEQRNQEAPRHPEVNQQNQTAFEPDNYILASSIDGRDLLAFELSGDLPGIEGTRQAFVENLDRDELPAGEDRRQLGPDRLDFGQLGHVR
jgi:hypothetical protein